MRLTASLLFLLFASAGMSAQSASPSAQNEATGQLLAALQLQRTIHACPVAFAVHLQSSLAVYTVKKGDAPPSGQELQLTFNHFGPDIIKASVTVHGIDARPRLTPMDNSTNDLSEVLDLSPGNNATTLRQSDVWTHTIKNVRWVELNSIQYTDGSTWHPTQTSHCIATISLLLPVSQAAK